MDSDTFLGVIGWVIGAAVVLGVQFFVIKYAVLSALRSHTMSSTSAVSVVSSVPLSLKQADAEVGEPRE